MHRGDDCVSWDQRRQCTECSGGEESLHTQNCQLRDGPTTHVSSSSSSAPMANSDELLSRVEDMRDNSALLALPKRSLRLARYAH